MSSHGRTRTKREPPRGSRDSRAIRQDGRIRPGVASYLAILLFVLCYAAAAVLWRVPPWVVGLYACVSVVAIVFYAIDKAAAQADGRRVPESTLLWLGLLGGWPGAILAQQLLRHKSSKVSFRRYFWFTVVVNVGVFVFLASPLRVQVLHW